MRMLEVRTELVNVRELQHTQSLPTVIRGDFAITGDFADICFI